MEQNSTPVKRDDKSQQEFLDRESRRPMKITIHPMVGKNKGKSVKSNGSGNHMFQPSSPTDSMISPCSRKLMRKKPSIRYNSDSDKDVNLDEDINRHISRNSVHNDLGWAPPSGLRIVLGSSSSERGRILEELGWTFTTIAPEVDERSIEVSEVWLRYSQQRNGSRELLLN